MEKGWGKSRYRIHGRFNDVCNVERKQDIHLSTEMVPAGFIQVSSALSVGKRSELAFRCWILVFLCTLAPGLLWTGRVHDTFLLDCKPLLLLSVSCHLPTWV